MNVSASWQWNAVALDEAHEMCINKDLKGAVVRPTSAYLQKTTLFFNEWFRAFKNLTQQLFPEKSTTKIQSVNTFTGTTISHKEENIRQMCAEIKKHKLLQLQPSTNRGMLNVFSGQTATREQANDILNCRQIRIESFKLYIQYHTLKTSSPVSAPVRHKRLLMMTTAKSKRKRTSERDKENKQVIQCLQRKLAWCKHNIQPDNFDEQFSIYPRALADEHGFPHKESKSTWTDKLQSWYQIAEPTVSSNRLLWTLDVVLIDAMFLINVRSLQRTKTISEYTSFIINQMAVLYYQAGTSEIHLFFVKSGRWPFIPKWFEHLRHYSNDDSISSENKSETVSDGSLDDGILTEEIITDAFNFKILDPA